MSVRTGNTSAPNQPPLYGSASVRPADRRLSSPWDNG